MVFLVSPSITKGLTIILEYALALTLKLLFLLLILLYVTILTSITILMMHILFAFEIIHIEACIYRPYQMAQMSSYTTLIPLWAYYYAYPNDMILPIQCIEAEAYI